MQEIPLAQHLQVCRSTCKYRGRWWSKISLLCSLGVMLLCAWEQGDTKQNLSWCFTQNHQHCEELDVFFKGFIKNDISVQQQILKSYFSQLTILDNYPVRTRPKYGKQVASQQLLGKISEENKHKNLLASGSSGTRGGASGVLKRNIEMNTFKKEYVLLAIFQPYWVLKNV